METVFEDAQGGRLTILETGDATAPMRFRMRILRGMSPPPERHPNQREQFLCISGIFEMGQIDGKQVQLRPGETFDLPAGTFHRPGNAHDEPVEIECTLTPGLDAARMFASIYTMGRTHRGMGMALRLALIFDRHRQEIDFPLPVRLAMRLMARIARRAGITVE